MIYYFTTIVHYEVDAKMQFTFFILSFIMQHFMNLTCLLHILEQGFGTVKMKKKKKNLFYRIVFPDFQIFL